MAEHREISFLPPWVPGEALAHFEVQPTTSSARPWRCARPTDDGWLVIGAGLRSAHERLRAMPAAEIVSAIDTVARRWTDRGFAARRQARDEVVAATGFSAEAVERSFDVELKNYHGPSLARTLRRELGDPAVLDGFRPDAELAGRTRAIGPRVTLAILTGNVPGLPALSIVRALLVKSAVIAKVASGEPTFGARFARTLAEAEPRLGDAIVVSYWERDDEQALAGALAQADAVIAYGGEAACAAVRRRVAPHQRYVEHGHKLSVGIVSRRYLVAHGVDEVARGVARDVSTFNQHACIAPQAYVVEGDPGEARLFAAAVAGALEAYARECPLGTLSEQDAASLQLRRAADGWRAAVDPARDLWRAEGLDWTVVLAGDLTEITGAGNRVVRIVPAASLEQAVALCAPIARHLQNVGLGALPPELWTIAEELARLGACRVCAPGRMAEPSLMWRHDGATGVGELVRWCDVEMHPALEMDA